ncbi:MAG TPA: DMT family transporter [Streptosporangiaceae bacterium]|nr:DMT family transporter [Streptosporangiaceae bacterium]
MELLILVLALVAGGLLAVQAAANLQLSTAVGGPIAASPLQLGIAAALLFVVAAGVGTLSAVTGLGDVPPWQLLGGLASPLYITAGMLLFPRLGALTSVGLFIAGQLLASLVIDGFGVLGVRREGLTVGALIGALAVVGGTAAIVRAQRSPEGGGSTARGATRDGGAVAGGRFWWVVLGLVAGGGLPVQAAINARLRAELDAPLTAAALSFAVATTVAALVLLILIAARRGTAPRLDRTPAMPWWGWLGGAAAAVYVTVSLLAIPLIGAAATVAVTVAGQQLASAAVDHYGLLRLRRRPVGTARLLGVLALLGGAAFIQFS